MSLSHSYDIKKVEIMREINTFCHNSGILAHNYDLVCQFIS